MFVMVAERGGLKSSSGTTQLAKGLLYQLKRFYFTQDPKCFKLSARREERGKEIEHPA